VELPNNYHNQSWSRGTKNFKWTHGYLIDGMQSTSPISFTSQTVDLMQFLEYGIVPYPSLADVLLVYGLMELYGKRVLKLKDAHALAFSSHP